MKNKASKNEVVTPDGATEQAKHPLLKSRRIVSVKDVEYNNLTAFEAVSMGSVFVLAVFSGVVATLPLG